MNVALDDDGFACGIHRIVKCSIACCNISSWFHEARALPRTFFNVIDIKNESEATLPFKLVDDQTIRSADQKSKTGGQRSDNQQIVSRCQVLDKNMAIYKLIIDVYGTSQEF